jgi:hypothetical protein
VIRDALLAALPPGRTLQWRYPADVIGWFPDPRDAARSHIGIHDDCFLSSPTDVGTYSRRPDRQAKQRSYVAQLTASMPFGGETCDAQPDAVRTGCQAILAEGATYHLTMLDRDYYTAFHRRWKRDGCFPEVRGRMGYRLALVSADAPDRVRPGDTAVIAVRLRNTGWARPINPRPLVLRLRDASSGRTIELAGDDLRGVDPAASSPTTFRFGWHVPANAPVGSYQLELAAPDASPSLAHDPRYALRFANADQPAAGRAWSPADASFRLGLAITVTR